MTSQGLAGVFAALFLASLAIGGCAAPSDSSGDETETVVAKPTEGELSPDFMSKTFYTANITRADIIAGGGSCVGNLCTINGRTYDCTGGGVCAPAS